MQARRFAFGPFVLDPEAGALLRKGEPVPLGYRAMLLLTAFLDRPGEVLTKSDLIDAAWQGAAVEEGNLSVQIAALRKLLGQSPEGGDWITTVPRVGYRFARTLHPDEGGDAPGEEEGAHPRRPSIAVMPFANVSGERDQDYFADGITEDIITALGSFRWFFVIARNSSFAYKNSPIDPKQIAGELGVRYLLEGSVRKSGESVRISARLVDAATSAQIWAERYDLAVAEVFAIQDEIAERVAGAIEPELLKTESNLGVSETHGQHDGLGPGPAGNLAFPSGHAAHSRRGAGAIPRSLPPRSAPSRSAHLACAGQRRIGRVWVVGRSRRRIGRRPWRPRCGRSTWTRKTLTPISLSPTPATFRTGWSSRSSPPRGPLNSAPALRLAHFSLGIAHLFSGRASEAIAPFERGLRLSPYDPQNPVWSNFLAVAQFFAGDAEGALVTSAHALGTRPDWRPIVETVACCYAATGKWDDARRCVQQMTGLPPLPYAALAPLWERNPHWRDQFR